MTSGRLDATLPAPKTTAAGKRAEFQNIFPPRTSFAGKDFRPGRSAPLENNLRDRFDIRRFVYNKSAGGTRRPETTTQTGDSNGYSQTYHVRRRNPRATRRNQLDEATLDRFRIGTVAMDYNEALERQLCPDADLYARLIGYRQRIGENRLNRLVSTRFLIDAYEMVAKWGWTDQQVDAQLFAGWRADEVAKVRN